MTFRQGKVIDHVAGRIHGKETLMCGIPSPTVKSRHFLYVWLRTDYLCVGRKEGGGEWGFRFTKSQRHKYSPKQSSHYKAGAIISFVLVCLVVHAKPPSRVQ